MIQFKCDKSNEEIKDIIVSFEVNGYEVSILLNGICVAFFSPEQNGCLGFMALSQDEATELESMGIKIDSSSHSPHRHIRWKF